MTAHGEDRHTQEERENALANASMLSELLKDEALLLQKAQELRAAASELAQMGEEGQELSQRAAQMESTAREAGQLANEIKAAPHKKIDPRRFMKIERATTLLIIETKEELVEADATQAEAQEEKITRAADPHPEKPSPKEAAPSPKETADKPREKKHVAHKEKQATANAKPEKPKPTPVRTAWQKTKNTVHAAQEKLVTGVKRLCEAAEECAEPLLHSAPVVVIINAGKKAVALGGALWDGSKKLAHAALHPVETCQKIAHKVSAAGSQALGKMQHMCSAAYHAVAFWEEDEVAKPAPAKPPAAPAKKISEAVTRKVKNIQLSPAIAAPKHHAPQHPLHPLPVYIAGMHGTSVALGQN